jgi:hypothetical protein
MRVVYRKLKYLRRYGTVIKLEEYIKVPLLAESLREAI